MAVQGVDTFALTNYSQAERTNEALGKDEFLKLLVTQLKYQDPMDPMDNTQFVAQLAQFSSLEQMQNMNTNFTQLINAQQMTQLSNLIGKKVKLWDEVTGAMLEDGVVGVSVVDGASKLILASGVTADIEDVVEIFAGEEEVVGEEVETTEEESNDETDNDTNDEGDGDTQDSNDGDVTGDGTDTADDPVDVEPDSGTEPPVEPGDTLPPIDSPVTGNDLI
jgi:flagellar basal-body rod modification protein FlgD